MTYFELSNVSFRYGGGGNERVLRDFSLTVERGEVVGLLGASGSGKSTLLRLIAGLEEPQAGRIVIDGRTMVGDGHFVDPERRGVGMVFQDYALFPHLTVEQNIAFGLHRLAKKKRAAKVDDMLELVQLREYKKRYPHELSGGQQQRAAFARALAPEPSMLLLDEPFSNLDADLKVSIRGQLEELVRAAGITTILVTHDIEDAEAICSRIVRIE